MAMQLQVLYDLRPEEREDVRSARELEARNDLFRHSGASDHMALLQHAHTLASLRSLSAAAMEIHWWHNSVPWPDMQQPRVRCGLRRPQWRPCGPQRYRSAGSQRQHEQHRPKGSNHLDANALAPRSILTDPLDVRIIRNSTGLAGLALHGFESQTHQPDQCALWKIFHCTFGREMGRRGYFAIRCGWALAELLPR